MNKLSNNDYLAQLNSEGILVKPLQEYQGRKVKILHRCVCGNEWMVTPNNVLKGQKCSECKRESLRDNHSKTNEDYLQELSERGIAFIPLANYNGALNPIQHMCSKGHIWDVSPANILSGKGCPICRNIKTGERSSLTHECFMERLSIVKNPEVKIIGKYQNANTRILCQCLKCGYEWEAFPSVLLKGGGCRKCADKALIEIKTKSAEQFAEEFYRIHPTLELLGEYVSAKDKVKCKCLVCNHIWDAISANLINQKSGCPICSTSRGERRIFSFLHFNNVDFISQQVFEGLLGVGGGLLSYDFYLPTYNTLIEYQGSQHESPKGGVFGGEDQFVIQQEHDKRKREYAKSHNINFLEIWYYDYDNIEQILTEYLNLNSESVETVTDV